MNHSKSSRIWLSLLLLVLIEIAVILQYRGPEPVLQPAAESPAVFSTASAIATHTYLFPDSPHPAGSPEQDDVRMRLVALLEDRGWNVELQSAMVRSRSDEPIAIHNVIARRDEHSELTSRPLVLSSHYDSCRYGPGAGDAGGCVVAILEAAQQIIADRSDLKRPVWLVITDAEEDGLLGAQELVASHPLSRQTPIVLNFDARGSEGPVVMYETHDGNQAFISRWVNSLAHPRVTGSLFTAIYRTLPNGTDFSIFAQAGWQGFNFAIIDGAHRYHKATDTLANLDRRSIQHFGNHALQLGLRIATDTVDPPSTAENAVFFDLLGLFVVHYPVGWALPLSISLLIVASLVYHQTLIGWKAASGVFMLGVWLLLTIAATTFTGWLFSSSLSGTKLLPHPLVAHGKWLCLTLWMLCSAMTLTVANGGLRRRDGDMLWRGLWWIQAVAAVLTAALAPEFSHLMLIPGGCAVLLSLFPISLSSRVYGSVLCTGLLLIPVQHLLSIAVGPTSGLLLGPAFALSTMPLIPLLGTRHVAVPNAPAEESDEFVARVM
jgi:hypothetical protein